MAIGVIYTELDLDLTKFEKKQRDLLDKIKQVASDSEHALQLGFQNLGVTSDKVYALMVEKARVSYERISQSANASFAEQTRAAYAAVAEINKINAQMANSQAFGGLGIRSAQMIAADKAAMMNWYDLAKAEAGKNSAELVRIEAAKDAKIQALDNELNAVQIANDAKRLASATATSEKIRAQGLMELEAATMMAKSKRDIQEKWASDEMAVRGRLRTEQEKQAAGYMSEMEWQKKMEATKSEAWSENAKRTREQGLIQIQATKDDVERTKKATSDKIAATNEHYNTLGMKSAADVKQRIADVNAAATAQQAIVGKSSEDWIRIERAKNEKLKALNREMTGEHEMSMASMIRAVLRVYAAMYVISTFGRYFIMPFEKGLKAVEDFNQSVIQMAAMVTSFSEKQKGVTLAEQWQVSLKYATAMIPILENIAAKTNLSGQETTALANAFARSGVFLNANNAAQVEGFIRLSNALPMMTQGQEIMRQINTEIRSVMTGQNTQSSMLFQTLHAMDPLLKEHLITWRNQGTVMENIGKMLEGFGPATELIERTWKQTQTTLDTTVTQILRGGMKPIYEELIKLAKEFNQVLVDSKPAIQKWMEGWAGAAALAKDSYKWAKLAFDLMTMGSPYKSDKEWDMKVIHPPPSPPPGKGAPDEAALKKAEDIQKQVTEIIRKNQLERDEIGKSAYEKTLLQIESEYKKRVSEGWAEGQANQARIAEKQTALVNFNEWMQQEDDKATIARYDAEQKVMKESDTLKRESYLADKKANEIALKNEADFYESVSKIIADNTEKQEKEKIDATEEYRKIMLEVEDFSTDRHLQSMNRILTAEEEKYKRIDELAKLSGKTVAEVEKDKAKIAENASKQRIKLHAEEFYKENDDRQQAFSSMARNFSDMANLYAEDSRERQALSNISKAATIAEIGLQVEKNLMIAIGAVVNQGTGDPYSAFARIAAMTAVVSGILAIGGIGFGGSGGGSASMGAAYGQNTTVLGGANNQGSESIGNTWNLLEDTYDLQKRTLTGIYENMKQLNANITGIVKGIVLKGSFMPGSSGSGADGLTNSLAGGGAGFLAAGGASSYLIGGMISMGAFTPALIGAAAVIAIDKILGTDIGGAIMGSLFGGGERVTGYGLSVGMGGKNVGGYQSTYSSGGMFSSDSEGISYGATDARLTALFSGPNGIYTTLQSLVSDMATNLGGDIAKAENKVFDAFLLNFDGLDTAGIQKAVSAKVSEIGDIFALEVFGADFINKYIKVNEGALETVSRLAVDLELVKGIIEMTGAKMYEWAEFFKAAWGFDPANKTDVLIDTAEALIELAGGIDKLMEASSGYYDKFTTDSQKQIDRQKLLTATMADFGKGLPATRDAYNALIKAQDIAIEDQRELYWALLKSSDVFDEYYNTLGDTVNRTDELTESLKALSQTIDDWLNNLNLSNLAPTQSATAWAQQYASRYASATSPAAEPSAITDFLAYATKYLEFQRTFGTEGSYQQIYNRVVADVTGIKQNLPSHATGLDYVPRDNYLARLHKGERVLTANESRGYSSDTNGGEVTVHSHIYLDGKEIQTVVAKGFKTNSDLIQSARRAVN